MGIPAGHHVKVKAPKSGSNNRLELILLEDSSGVNKDDDYQQQQQQQQSSILITNDEARHDVPTTTNGHNSNNNAAKMKANVHKAAWPCLSSGCTFLFLLLYFLLNVIINIFSSFSES